MTLGLLVLMKLWKGIPAVTAEEMARIDEVAMNEYHLSLFSMMENAGRLLAIRAREMLEKVEGVSVVLLIGPGHNGGGGLVAGRFLSNWGARVEIVLAEKHPRFRDAAAQQFLVLDRMEVPIVGKKWNRFPDLFIDAFLGYGGKGDPRELMAEIITEVNKAELPILALDLPSGLDATTGIPNNPCIEAASTLTLALPKTGLISKQAQPYVGTLYLADIGIPNGVYREVTGQDVIIFQNESIVNLSAL